MSKSYTNRLNEDAKNEMQALQAEQASQAKAQQAKQAAKAKVASPKITEKWFVILQPWLRNQAMVN
ncbi:hypothetical protein [Kingella negevensis]|uniref:hypothetical protein n=1 Tax=Kingella negevensis TaxID=1522312 RepID=UPI00254B7B6A|nr:hypothetical protein [Kingella negevensis]MDK4680489.1 hypothetical protein [Kingella negevensis]MDK4681788.1 hypothetical protein [Kingella negevensis]MDK4689985.1 hypothetical protein [Kingella negevensis]MDK4692670.1 hypothetical protein [Kingella negevensis]MDK4698969.1 hypothetical protein [Kingella negevensis]